MLCRTNSILNRHGFTLVEILVVISIIAILLAISIPALLSARASARETVSLSNIRQSGLAIETYLNANSNTYPYFIEGTWLRITPTGVPEPALLSPGHYDLSQYWPTLMHELLPWPEHFEAWVGPGDWNDTPWLRNGFAPGSASYRLTHSFLARPGAWQDGIADDRSFRAPVRISDVRFPSTKVLLYDQDLTQRDSLKQADRDPDRRPVAFPDGHASQKRRSEATPPARIAWKEQPRAWDDTPNGASGSDY